MPISLIVALAAAHAPVPRDQTAPPPRPSICASGNARDRVEVRVFPIGMVRRVWPAPQEIIERGGRGSMVRQFWSAAMGAICDPTLPDADESAGEFLPRIVVFINGEENRDPILIEYPDWGDDPAPVRARVNGRMVALPASVVRKLLDYSREGWREGG